MPHLAFPPAHRLANPSDFDRVFSHATYRVGNAMVLMLALGNGLGHNRLGMVVGKKKIPSAVARNRAKRVIRDSFRRQPCIAQGMDLVVLVRSGSSESHTLAGAMANAFKRLASKAEATVTK